MNQSKPGQKLAECIAKETAPIFARDPRRYDRLALWVWAMQKAGWPDEAIAAALRMGDGSFRNLDTVNNWWSYLTALMPKAKGRAAEIESNEYKQGDLTSFGAILKKIIATIGN